jgi:hypothetical protein
MKSKTLYAKISVLLVGMFSLVLAPAVMAVGVKPLRTELTIDPGASATATLMVINSENKELKLKPEVQVYVSNDAAGFPVVADLAKEDPRNITDWISFSDNMVTLSPNESRKVDFTVKVPAGAEPGGRYASVVYSPVNANGEKEGVALEAQVASLILVTVAGEEKLAGNVESFGIKDGKIYGDKAVDLAVSFKNNGNVHVKAKGWVSIFDDKGTQLTKIARYTDAQTGQEVVGDKIPVNLTEGNVLPGSSRLFSALWNENIVSGKFRADLELQYGKGQSVLKNSTNLEIADGLTVNSFDLVTTPEASNFKIAVTNTGSVYQKLSGNVKITNEYDAVVATPAIPADAEYIAPGATAEVIVPWLTKEVPKGKYTAELVAAYGFAKTPVSMQTTFSSDAGPDMKMVGGIAGGLVLLAGLGLLASRFGKGKK